MGMTIGKLIVQRDNFKVDETYQRPPDAWSNKDKQCFIDTILRNEPVPLFFINEKDEDGKYIRKERYTGAVSRSFYVGKYVTEEDIHAKFENGILKLSVPKVDAPKVEENKYISIEG